MAQSPGGQGADALPAMDPPAFDASRIATIPNAISGLRLACIPVFLWLVLGPHRDRLGFVVLVAASSTDFIDGWLARRLNQITRLGALLDPLADRLYIAATTVALCVRGICPWWLLAVLATRDLVLAGMLVVLKRHGFGPPPVTRLGKAATLNLLYAFPSLLLTTTHDTLGRVARALGWAFTGWGSALYLLAGVLYLWQTASLIRARRPVPAV